MNKSHNRRPFGKAKVNRWVKRYTHKRYRGKIKQIVKYAKWLSDEPHLPLWKDINNPWNWD